MFEDPSGRLARNVDQAERYLWTFMQENMSVTERHIAEHSRDFDLFLPWLLEIVSNQRVSHDQDVVPIFDLERIYMDAAWSLVMQGYLRPGPKVVTGDIRDGYGKGYSLTIKGLQRMESLPPIRETYATTLGVSPPA